MTPHLFQPFELKDVRLRNRIAVSPMCQYSAIDGVIQPWHHYHLAGLARGGSGLVIAEATAVAPEGRITPACTGIWNDSQAAAWEPVVGTIRDFGAVPGIQIAHAGRKASANRPWEGDDHMAEDDPRGWQTIAPSAIAFGGALSKVPRAMTLDDIERVKRDFAAAAARARDVGFQWLELHFAHGYLAQSFLSRHSNQRDDAYGGSAENRGRFLEETLAAVRKEWPANLPLAARMGVIEYDGRDEETLVESIELLKRMRAGGLDLIDVSIGFSIPDAKVPWGPAFLAPIAGRIRQQTGLVTATSWYISDPGQADSIVRNEQVDIVMLGRPLLVNPHWPYQAAMALGREQPAWVLPAPYAHWLSRYREERL